MKILINGRVKITSPALRKIFSGIRGVAIISISGALIACSAYSTALTKATSNEILGKTEEELMRSYMSGASGLTWRQPQSISKNAAGEKVYFYKFYTDQGNHTENCGLDGMRRIQYVCTYNSIRYEEREVYFGLDGRVRDWKVLRTWRETKQI